MGPAEDILNHSETIFHVCPICIRDRCGVELHEVRLLLKDVLPQPEDMALCDEFGMRLPEWKLIPPPRTPPGTPPLSAPTSQASNCSSTEEQLLKRVRTLRDYLRTRSENPEECAQGILDNNIFEGRVVCEEERRAAFDFLAENRMARYAAGAGTSYVSEHREEDVNWD